jgi:hypothetical protein
MWQNKIQTTIVSYLYRGYWRLLAQWIVISSPISLTLHNKVTYAVRYRMSRHLEGLYTVQYIKSNPIIFSPSCFFISMKRGRRGRDRMVVGFTTTYAINIYHDLSCEFESHSWRAALNTTLCDKVCQWLAKGWRLHPVSITNKADRHDITETITLTRRNE